MLQKSLTDLLMQHDVSWWYFTGYTAR